MIARLATRSSFTALFVGLGFRGKYLHRELVVRHDWVKRLLWLLGLRYEGAQRRT